MKFKTRWLWAKVLVIVGLWAVTVWLFVHGAEDSGYIFEGCIYAPLSAALTIEIIGDFRVIYLTSEGCKVVLFWIKKEYKWEDVRLIYDCLYGKGKRIGPYHGLLFSTRTVNWRGMQITNEMRRMQGIEIHWFQDFHIVWKDKEERSRTLTQLEQWGVKVEISDIVKHKELVDAKTEARNERRRLYEERKRQAKNKKNSNS